MKLYGKDDILVYYGIILLVLVPILLWFIKIGLL